MKRFALLPAICTLLAAPCWAEEATVPNRAEAAQLFLEITELMDASAIIVPELARAGAPLTENVRQATRTLEVGRSREHAGVVYRLLTNARVYLQLVDALPKPASFSGDVRKQIELLRAKTDRVELYFRTLLDRREEQVRGSDRDNLARYSEANGRLGPPSSDRPRVVFLGDSITDGWELNQYFPGRDYVNRGIGGQITGEMLGRLKADVIDLKPGAVVLLGGTNDLARGVSLETIQNNILMIAELSDAQGIRPILSSVLPISDYHADTDPRYRRSAYRPPASIVELNRWIRDYCAGRGFIYIDYYAATTDSQGMLAADLADDGLHPNLEGYKKMAPLAQQAVDQALRTKPVEAKKKRFGVF